MDELDRIVAFIEDDSMNDYDEWEQRHRSQSSSGVDINDAGNDGASGSVCASYDSRLNLDINTPSRDHPSVRGLEEKLTHRLHSGTICGVMPDITTGCEPIFDNRTDLPAYDGEMGDSAYYAASTTICMRTLDFLRIQYVMGTFGLPSPASIEEWANTVSNKQIELMRESIRNRDREFPRPYIVFDSNGDITVEQEGRHRSVAAMKEGVERMDIYAFWYTKHDRGKPERKFTTPPETVTL